MDKNTKELMTTTLMNIFSQIATLFIPRTLEGLQMIVNTCQRILAMTGHSAGYEMWQIVEGFETEWESERKYLESIKGNAPGGSGPLAPPSPKRFN